MLLPLPDINPADETSLSLSYVVNLPSSFMIVSSFTPSYSLLAYLFQILGTVNITSICKILFIFKLNFLHHLF